MSQRLFSEQEMELLNASPYVLRVSKRMVKFTPEFKQLACAELSQGKNMREILEGYSINPELLGETRVRGLQQKIEEQSEREEGFKDMRSENSRKPKKKETCEQERIEQLEHELAYTRQEIEFLKKIVMANTEAQKRWESKHRPA